MQRREFIIFIGGAAAWPLVVQAEQVTRIFRIGLLSPFSPADTALWHQALLRGLRDLGWIDGKNIAIEYRYAEGRNDRLPKLIDDLVRLKVDIIVTAVTNDTLAAKHAAGGIPIVMAAAGDPVATGIVASLARPGGNITGLSQMNPDLTGKRLELLKEIAPKIASVAVLLNPDDPISSLGLNEIELPARKLKIEVHALPVRDTDGLDGALQEAAKTRIEALAIMPNPVFVKNLKRIADFALQNRLPSMFHLREFAEAGGLLSYGADRTDLFLRAATFVDKILKGARPADLPIEQPTKFDLTINLKTAKTIGLTVPPALIASADDVIE
jgi:putative ABC transport system substrate-binding protein